MERSRPQSCKKSRCLAIQEMLQAQSGLENLRFVLISLTALTALTALTLGLFVTSAKMMPEHTVAP